MPAGGLPGNLSELKENQQGWLHRVGDGANSFKAITSLPERVWRKQISTAHAGHSKPEQKM